MEAQMKIIVKLAKPETEEERQFKSEILVDPSATQTRINILGTEYLIEFQPQTSKIS
jgi:hypothetical protein